MKITAVYAGLGAAVGAILFLALRFVVGQSVLEALPITGSSSGLPRRYVDYLVTSVGSSSVDPVRLLPVLVGTGLVAGLLLGVVLRVFAARRPVRANRLVTAGALAASGLVVGILLAVQLRAYGRHTFVGGSFGWYSYSPLGNSPAVDGVFYGGGPAPSWWPLVLTGAVVGLAVGALAAAGAVWTGRSRRA